VFVRLPLVTAHTERFGIRHDFTDSSDVVAP
jgi:hypothetical protein